VVRQHLADSDSTNLDWQNGLAFSYERIGRALAAQGKAEEALSSFNKSIEIWRQLAEKDPSHTNYETTANSVYEKISNLLLAPRRYDDALAAFRNMAAGFQALVDRGQSDAHIQRSLSVAWERVGDVFLTLDKGTDALDAYQKSLTIRKAAADVESSVGRQIDLAIIQNKIGNALRALGRNEEAL